MKIISTLILSIIANIAFAQNVPITFEAGENGTDWTWKVFENDDDPAMEIVDNPDKNINTSNKVAKFTARATGQPYAGCETLHGADIGEYKITAVNSIITIMVHKPVISDVGIKLVTATGWSKGELKVANTKINEWEELTFDFSSVNHEDMTYDQIVVFPDFKDRSDDHVVYFDNITIGDKEVNGISNQANNIEFYAYPNPTTGKITLPENTATYSIMTLAGKEVLSGNLNKVDLTALTTGMYTILATLNDGSTAYSKVSKQ